MEFQTALLAATTYVNPKDFNPEGLDTFQRHIDTEWIEEALEATGTATVRRRRLPAVQVVWLVIGMALFRNRAIDEVVAKLNLALPGPRGVTVAPSAIPPARARVGDAPMDRLFHRTGSEWAGRSADAHRWRGLALYGFDGSKLNVADSRENRRTFGGHSGKRGDSGYPMVRIMVLMALRSHLLAGARFGPYKGTSEASLVRELLPTIADDSLTIMDRNFVNAPTLIPLRRDGDNRHWLTRAKKNTRMKKVERLGKGDDLVELNVSDYARKQDPSLPKTGWVVRAIQYQRKGFKPQILLTSLLDPQRYPAKEIVARYHDRWEIELGYDEIKTDMLERREAIRSKTPAGVRQEVWGILLAFNLVRLEMEEIAKEAGVPPTRISFVASMNMIRDEWFWCAVASPGSIPKHLRNLRADLKRFILPPRRPERSYPRAVKIKMSSYKKKRPAAATAGLK